MSTSNECRRVPSDSTTCSTDETAMSQPICLFDKLTINFYSVVCFAMAMLLAVIISISVILRYFLKMDLYGYEEWIKIAAFWLYFLGAGYGAFAGTHVNADIVQAYIKDGVFKHAIVVVKCIVTLVVTLLFTYYGWKYFWFGFRGVRGTGVAIPKTVAWRIPMWLAYLPIFLGLLSMSYYFARDLLVSVKRLLQAMRGNN